MLGKQDMVIMKCTMVQAMNHQKCETLWVSDLMDDGISGPTVIFIVNENTRESMIFGMKNDNFNGNCKIRWSRNPFSNYE